MYSETGKINGLQGEDEHHRWAKFENYACRKRRLQDRKQRIFGRFFDVLMEKYSGGDKIYAILDNGPANISKNTRNEAEKHNIILHYLHPYSPNLNPIEHLCKLIHEHARNNKFFTLLKTSMAPFFISLDLLGTIFLLQPTQA